MENHHSPELRYTLSGWKFNFFPFPTNIEALPFVPAVSVYTAKDPLPKLVRPDGMWVAVLKDLHGGFEFFNFMTISSSRQEAEDKQNQFKKQIPEFFRHCVPQRIAEIRVEEL